MPRSSTMFLCLFALSLGACDKDDKDKSGADKDPKSEAQEADAKAEAPTPPDDETPDKAEVEEAGKKGCMNEQAKHCTELESGDFENDGVCMDGKLVESCPKEDVAARCESDGEVQFYYEWKPMYESLCEARKGKLIKD